MNKKSPDIFKVLYVVLPYVEQLKLDGWKRNVICGISKILLLGKNRKNNRET